MKLFGIQLGKRSPEFGSPQVNKGWSRIFDWTPGAWQMDAPDPNGSEVSDALGTAVVYACIRQIVWDISKLPMCVKRLTAAGIWEQDAHATLDPLFRKPNAYQTWIDFLQCWLSSWLITGNAYVVMGRVGGKVKELHVLDPASVTVLVAKDTGAVFYQVGADDGLAGIQGADAVFPASDMMHHRYLALAHPLIGSSALARALAAARMRSGVIETAADLHENGSVPPGLLIAPEGYSEEQLKELADKWAGRAKGRIAVVDAAFKFESVAAKYIDAQSKEFAELSALDICSAFNMPPWKVGAGTRPAGFDVEAQQIVYYQDCLQLPLEHLEAILDDGLQLARDVSVEFEVEYLTMLDSKTRAEVDAKEVGAAIKTPNEARARRNLPPKEGGDDLWMQQQNYSLPALIARDKAGPPTAPGSSSPAPAAPGGDPRPSEPADEPAGPVEPATSSRFGAGVLPWAGVWKRGREYPALGVFVTHKRALWARVQRQLEGTDEILHEPGEEVGAEPGTDAGAPYWQLAVASGEAPEGN